MAPPTGATVKRSGGIAGTAEVISGKTKRPTEFPSALGYTAASGYSPGVIKARARYEERDGHVLHPNKVFRRCEGKRLSVVRKCAEKGRPVPPTFAVPVTETYWYATNRMRYKMRVAARSYLNPAVTKRCGMGAAF